MTDVKYEIRIYTAPPKVKYEICNYAGGREKVWRRRRRRSNFGGDQLRNRVLEKGWLEAAVSKPMLETGWLAAGPQFLRVRQGVLL